MGATMGEPSREALMELYEAIRAYNSDPIRNNHGYVHAAFLRCTREAERSAEGRADDAEGPSRG